MKINDTRYDFRMGTIGQGLRVRPDTKAFASGLRGSQNMMVLADATMKRRWGSWERQAIPTGECRLETWEFAEGDTTSFLLLFTAGQLEVLDGNLGNPVGQGVFTGMPWDASSLWFLTVTFEREKLVVCDASFRTKVFTYDSVTQSFSEEDFEFENIKQGETDTPLASPFHEFQEDIRYTLTNFLTQENSGYGPYMRTAFTGIGITGPSDQDLLDGTGRITIHPDDSFHLTGREDQHLRLGEGEIRITNVVSQKVADYIVVKDVGLALEQDPCLCRKNSKMIEIAHFNHGAKKNWWVFFYGVPAAGPEAEDTRHYLTDAPKWQTNIGQVGGPQVGPAAFYAIQKIKDDDHFEVSDSGANSDEYGLMGGSDMRAIIVDGEGYMKGIKEPVFSDQRGWPTCGTLHESRLWLGGSDTLPDAIFGSQFGQYRNFDMGVGDPGDGVTLLSIGQQARVRHLKSEFDLLIFTDQGEFYAPGSVDRAITQETARVVNATEHGCSYTTPVLFDGGTFFIDLVGRNVREMKVENRDESYAASPVSLVVPEWINQPRHSAMYRGAVHNNTPYVFWSNIADGSAIVMHANRNEDFFGFMRWTLDDATFVSFAGLSSRLFAVARRKSTGTYFLLEFDTLTDDAVTTDFSFHEDTGGTTYGFGEAAGRSNIQIEAKPDGTWQVYSAGLFNVVDGIIEFPEEVSEARVGDRMSAWADVGPPKAQVGTTNKLGETICLVKVDINWLETQTGYVAGEDVVTEYEQELFGPRGVVDVWKPYWVSLWDREPVLRIEASEPGHFGVRAMNLTVKI